MTSDTKEIGVKDLGYLYIARKPCGCVSALCWDDPNHKKDTAKLVAGYIRRGDAIERLHRFEKDPMPEMSCNEHKDKHPWTKPAKATP